MTTHSNRKTVTNFRDRYSLVANFGKTLGFMDLSPPWELLKCRLSLGFPAIHQFDNLSWNISLIISAWYLWRLSF